MFNLIENQKTQGFNIGVFNTIDEAIAEACYQFKKLSKKDKENFAYYIEDFYTDEQADDPNFNYDDIECYEIVNIDNYMQLDCKYNNTEYIELKYKTGCIELIELPYKWYDFLDIIDKRTNSCNITFVQGEQKVFIGYLNKYSEFIQLYISNIANIYNLNNDKLIKLIELIFDDFDGWKIELYKN